MKKKILFTVPSYYPLESGVPVVVKYLAEGLAIKGYDVHIATKAVTGCEKDELYKGVHIHRFNINYSAFKRIIGDIEKYINFITGSTWDVLICECTECPTTDAVLPYLDEIKAEKILHSHGFGGRERKFFQWRSTLRNTIANTVSFFIWKKYYAFQIKKHIRKFDICISLSEADKGKPYLEKYSKSEVKILENAADDMFFEKKSEKNALDRYIHMQHKKYVISVANYSEVKNQIGILKEFYKCKSDIALLMIGSKVTPYYTRLIKLNKILEKKYGKREVHFIYAVDRSDLPDIIAGATIYVAGSSLEQYSISLIEAMACGVPFVSTNVGNARLLPGGVTVDRIGDLHKEIDRLINNPEKLNFFSTKGREYARANCRISVAVNRLEFYMNQ